jgi:hypothetical protein
MHFRETSIDPNAESAQRDRKSKDKQGDGTARSSTIMQVGLVVGEEIFRSKLLTVGALLLQLLVAWETIEWQSADLESFMGMLAILPRNTGHWPLCCKI